MADDALSEAWEKAAKDITKGKNEGALQTLRVADPHAIEPMTARLVGEATWNIAKSSGSKSDYRKAAMFLREASKKNPKDKKTGSLYNKLLNEMQDKRISETVIPRMFNNGGPTPAGIFAIFGGFLLVLGLITIANSEPTTTDIVEFDISWSENGVAKSGQVTIELYPDAAPIHVENFRLLVQNGDYDGTSFHRVIGDNDQTPEFDPFMIQGGDFTNGDGTGGHAAKWFGYCNGMEMASESECTQGETAYTIPDEADNGLLHEECTISMAKTKNPHTGGSQFFLIPRESTPNWLDGVHTVFGQITSGCDHVSTIAEVATDEGDRPDEEVKLVSATFVGSETEPWYKFW
ncbi:MAG: peptidylprolyl isomerase [Candidatus Thermoplasmatota archaeon]|nr:peptidylprolyl isomerase [Candidatus Thermoplasmatota archaeon]MEC7254216.1 peptidylprolyl isomerase [Candidatus Thermoplasmatota archaeon]